MEPSVVIPEVALASDIRMPVIGLGTSSSPPAGAQAVRGAVLEAIKAGYRHFDTASLYGSEEPLGEAIAEAIDAGLVESRREVFVTSKLWATSAEPQLVLPSIKNSLRNLKLEYLDLYLIHMPLRLSRSEQLAAHPLDIKSVWEAMEECQKSGLARAIGVSNFSCKKLAELLSSATIPPAVNQVEMNPLWHQKQLREFCEVNRIHITAYSPLGASGTSWGDNRVLENDVLQGIAKTKGKSVAQVSLRWLYEQGVSMVAKSFDKDRMRSNLDIFSWSLTEEETEKIDQLPQRKGVLLASVFGHTPLCLELDSEI
uniref:NADP-dependent oxidoreductase domain-containing protein n=1 Tax=Kalanchoe fedtschenkoi TaxID=63787 RepID=A0A7N0TV61_KALFE